MEPIYLLAGSFKGIRSFYTCKSRRRPPPRSIRVERPPIPLCKGPSIRNEVGHSAKKPNEIVKIFFVNQYLIPWQFSEIYDDRQIGILPETMLVHIWRMRLWHRANLYFHLPECCTTASWSSHRQNGDQRRNSFWWPFASLLFFRLAC